MHFILNEAIHFTIAFIIGGFCSVKYQNWLLLPASLLFGFFIDADHLFDYFRFFGVKFNPKKFFDTKNYMEPSNKIFVLLHGWEYIFIFWFIGKFIAIPGLQWAMLLSYFGHLLWDNFSFKHHPLAYFISYRLFHKFGVRCFEEKDIEN